MASTEITFDKLVYIDRPKSGGIAEPQAREHAEALDQALRDTVATKQDLVAVRQDLAAAKQELRDEIRDLRDEMRSEIQGLRDEMRSEIQGLRDEIKDMRGEMRGEIARLENKIEILGRDLKIWMGGMLILLFGALASLKFFG